MEIDQVNNEQINIQPKPSALLGVSTKLTPMIYILLCENGKYYIGKTDNINEIFKFFFPENSLTNSINREQNALSDIPENRPKNFDKIPWTKKYKPIKILEYFESEFVGDENFYTEKYMINYGLKNVRGGKYKQLTLTIYQIKNIAYQVCGVEDKCFACGQHHSVKDCLYFACFNCGNISHFTSECPKLNRKLKK